MLPKQLRNGILHLAITGKLVEQDPNDEPASVLLEKIRAGKQELIKVGKIKKDKNESVIYRNPDGVPYEKIGDKEQCIAEQIPFEIPNSWEWVRLGSLVYNRGQKKPNQNFCYIDIGSIDNKNHKLNENETIITPENAPSRARKIVNFDDIIYSTVRPYLHNICIIDKKFSYEPIASTGFAVMTCYKCVINKYLFYNLISPFFDKYVLENSRGTAYPAINDENFYKSLIPLPPLEEQKRIVEKLEKLLPLVDEYEENYNELEKLDNEFPDKFKKSILQYAIQGKLVKQDPNDEPASVLLEKIRAEKQELIKAGKIKKDKNEAVIYRKTSTTQHDVSYKNINNGCFASNEKDQNEGSVDFYEKFANGKEKCINDELPFEIPSSWEWVRLGNVANINGGYAFNSYEFTSTGLRVIRISDFNEKGFVNKNIVRYKYNNAISNFLIKEEDILLCMTGGTVGKSYFVDKIDEEMAVNQRVAKITGFALKKYIYYVLISIYIKNLVQANKNSTNDNISMIFLTNLLIPLPPLAEQKRIVAKIEELFKIIEPLTEK